MENNQLKLLAKKEFLPLFITQFLGAFNDNFYKNALIFGMVFGVLNITDVDPKIVITLSAGLFILPFFLFSAIGGQIADKFPKNKIIRSVKMAEIGIAIIGSIGLFIQSMPVLLMALFLLGVQSAIFGPSKLAILPEQLKKHELIAGNGLISAGTFMAILAGTIAGGLVITRFDNSIEITSAILILCAIMGYISSLQIPTAKALQPKLKVGFNFITESCKSLSYAVQQPRGIFLSILGIAWFYFIGGTFLAQFPNYAKENLNVDELVLTVFLFLFSVGVALGAVANNKLLKGRIEATYVPLAALGMSLFALDLSFLDLKPFLADQSLKGLNEFFQQPLSWRICFDLFAMAFFAGLYVVPLNTIIQERTPESHRARVLASSAIMDALFIVISSIIAAAMLHYGADVEDIFLVVAIGGLCVALYICRLLPDYLFKSLMQGLFKTLYKVEVRGLENYEKAGERVVIVSNHVALLDPPLLAAFIPGKPMFAVNSFVAEWPLVKPFRKVVDMFPLDPTNPYSIKSLIKEVEKDKKCIIFPEGRLTETGALMKVYEGPGMIADKSDAMILPVRLDGVQHTPFARLKGKVPLRSFPKITITILPPRKFELDKDLKGRARRAAAGRKLYDLMEKMMYLTTDRKQTLYEALLKARYVNGDDAVIAEDAEFKPLKFKKLIQGSVVLGKKFTDITEKSENVGVLLPNSVGAIVTFFGLQAYGRVPAMLNFSVGAKAVNSAIKTAQVKTVITSRRFVELGKLEELIEGVSKNANIIYLEDIRDTIGLSDKLNALVTNPERLHRKRDVNHNDPAVVLFTSGSEGEPKGVVLSHTNLMTNIVQLSSRVDFNRQDIVFNCLPMFHSFGLTGGTLLPVLSGVKTFLYPSPLHYRIVPELVYSSNATIMFGTDTFLSGYGRMANPYDFYRMRYIFAGAEKVKDETRQLYMERFGVRVLEGYGATETAPVIAVNSPMHQRPGTVGRLLSGLEYRLEDVEGVDEGGRLHVRGDNVMLGYYMADNPGVIKPPQEGWHDTGDIVGIDEDGFVRILGRAKRFAKIAGEMVSLSSAETMVQNVYPEAEHAVVTIPDARKGEQLILVTTQKKANKRDLSKFASANGIAELAVPKTIIEIDKIPLLGTGKTDYKAVQVFVDEKTAKAA